MRVATTVGGWSHSTPRRRFVRHLLEMTAAMMLGMCVLGSVFGELHVLVFGSSLDTAWHRHVGLTAVVMAFDMTLPMVLWMRHRGHSWERGAEMAAAMFVPTLLALALFWAGAMSNGRVLPLAMALMLPGMLLAMLYRREEYSVPHPRALPQQGGERIAPSIR